MPTATSAGTRPAPDALPGRRRPGAAVPAQAGPPDREAPDAEAALTPADLLCAPDAAASCVLRVERGTASAEEIAAVTTVLLARAAAARAAQEAQSAAARRAGPRWRSTVFAGPRAWTADARDLLAG